MKNIDLALTILIGAYCSDQMINQIRASELLRQAAALLEEYININCIGVTTTVSGAGATSHATRLREVTRSLFAH